MRNYNSKITSISKFICLLAFFSCCLAEVALGQVNEAEKFDALQMIERGQPKKAVDKLEKLVSANAADASLLYYLGYAQIKNGEPQKALASFDKGIQLNDKEGLNYVGKGYLKLSEQKAGEAKPLFDKALELTKSKNAPVLNAIANAYLSNKQNLPDAEKLLLKSKSVNSNDMVTLVLLGDSYLAQNNGGEAMNSYERAAELNAKSGLPFYKIGMVFLRSRNYEEAEKAFKKAVAADPTFALAFKELGELYYAKKDGANAVKAQESYMALNEDPNVGKLQYGFYLFMAKEYAKANELFEHLIALPTVLPITYKFYAKSLFEIGDKEKSYAMYQKFFETAKPEEIQASDYNFVGKMLFELRQPPLDSIAINYFTQSLTLDSMQLDILQSKAETLYRRKRFPEAAAVYKKLISLRPKPVSADYFGIGRSSYYSEQMVDADSAFTKLIKLQPAMTVGYVWMARIKSSQDPESTQGLAKPYFEKVIEIASANPEKNKNDLIEAYSYLGYYYYLKNDKPNSILNWKNVLKLDPNNERAKEAVRILTAPPQAQPESKK
jgi:tetratricopeptide (TPR) repeat protein